MHRFSEKQLLIVILAGGLLLALLAGVAIWYIDAKRIKPLEDDYAKADADYKTEKEKVDKIPGLEKQEKESEAKMAEAREMLPTLTESPIEDFYEMMSALGQQCNIDVGNLGYAPGPAKPDAVFDTQVWTVSLKGGFFELLTFIYKLETMKRFIKVNSFNFSGGAQVEQPGGPPKRMFSLSLKLSSYTFKEPAAAKK